MVKKNVPDWLNSSLWASAPPQPSSPPPNDDLPSRSSSKSTEKYVNSSSSTSVYAPGVDAPIPVPPPAAVRRPDRPPHPPPPQISGTSDPLRSSSGSGSNCVVSSNNDSEKDASAMAGAGASPEDISRQAQLFQEVISSFDYQIQLSRKVINMGELRKLASQGLPDGAGIRSTVWKLLLGYLPKDRSLWSSELAKKRSQYNHFKEELLMNPSVVTRRENDNSDRENTGLLSRSEIPHGEHPLSLGKSSIWNQYFQDSEIIEQIDRDVMRTHPDMHFFSGDSPFAKSNQESLKNILIVFAKLNPGIKYVQGMNEVLAPIFYIFRNDPNEENAASAEADAFFCFVELLSGFRDHFCQQLDNSVVGIRATITKLSQLLKEHDEELWRHLELTSKVNPQFYAFRWITLLLTQEFNFADSLHIWDTILSDPEGPHDTLLRICCAMLILIRRRLLAGDFTANLKLLQHYPPTNISHLLYVANKLRSHSVG